MADFQHENGTLSSKNAKNLESPRKFRTFAVSIIKTEKARKAAKYLSQACKNFLPAQGAKNPSGNRQNELINHKLQIFELF